MSEADRHPSFLQLDRIALGADAPEWSSHVSACPRCSAYVNRQRQPVNAPEWTRIPRLRILPFRWLPSLAAAGAVASLALALFAVRASAPPTDAKGAPSVAVYVQRGDTIALWDGQQPLAPGDRLQLEIRPEGMPAVAVALRTPAGEWEPLYQGRLTAPTGRIPESWRLDATPGPETLGIALSHEPLSPGELIDVLDRGTRDVRVWTTVLALRKRLDGEGR
jgi:hypothetical protein